MRTKSSTSRLRRPVKLFKQGDQVEVFVPQLKRWMRDGEVAMVASESVLADGVMVRAGSMKVLYARGQRQVWVAPQNVGKLVRESHLPDAPAALEVELRRRVEGWLCGSWSPGYAALKRGFLHWWGSAEDAKNGKEPSVSVFLLGLQRQLRSQTILELRSDGDHGVLHRFMAACVDVAQQVLKAVDAHAKYCEASREVEASLEGTQGVCRELRQLSVLRDIKQGAMAMSDTTRSGGTSSSTRGKSKRAS